MLIDRFFDVWIVEQEFIGAEIWFVVASLNTVLYLPESLIPFDQLDKECTHKEINLFLEGFREMDYDSSEIIQRIISVFPELYLC